MKGLILAGGRGTRLDPLTRVTNKHLLPVFDRPMIYYPLRTLKLAGVKEIMIITSDEYTGDFLHLLGSGKEFGLHFTFGVQDKPLGIAHALSLAEKFAANDDLAVILGDNIFAENFTEIIRGFSGGAHVFLKKVKDPERFGVPKFKQKKIIEFVEKPKRAPSSYAVTGLYIYDRHVFHFIRTLKPSKRGELEITEVNNKYLLADALSHSVVENFWSDAGTFESLFRAGEYVRKYPKKFSSS